VRAGQPMPRLPEHSAATLDGSADPRGAALAFRRLGNEWLRIDLADRLASHAHQVRQHGGEDPVDRALATSIGLDEAAVRHLMAEVGFVPAGEAWSWRGHRRPRRREPEGPRPGNAFAALAGLKR
jgi:ATP-dependent RNA helicase SUPV3L1/SUV3